MNVKLTGPVYPVDSYAVRGFIEIFNIIVTAEHAADLNLKLIKAAVNPQYRSLHAYFKWEWDFDESRFYLQQRLHYRSLQLFDTIILTVSFDSIKAETQDCQTLN